MIKNRSYFPGKHQFYGRRKGYSISESRLKLINELLPKLLIDLEKPGLITPSLLFNKGADVWLEVGFGAGEHLVAQAERYPDIGFIGCEPYINGVARVLSAIRQKSLNNIVLHNDDARQVLEKLAPASISKVFILFSDPWPKKRHHRRRVIFSGAAVSAVKKGEPQPEWLLNITNDAWFGVSSGPYQHLAAAQLRAVEEGLPLVRVANTGISAVIDGFGRIYKASNLNERTYIDSPLPMPLVIPTIFSKIKVVGIFPLIFLILILSRFRCFV